MLWNVLEVFGRNLVVTIDLNRKKGSHSSTENARQEIWVSWVLELGDDNHKRMSRVTEGVAR